jgi:protein-L-isoaspartate(D-aspartate) O-methyltransferase
MLNRLKHTIILVSMITVLFTDADSQDFIDDEFTIRRENMVKTQIKNRGINDDQVIEAMLRVERHLFVPEIYLEEAYADHPVPIGEGQTISQPYIVAFMTEALNLKKKDRVLEIGTGSGYQAAILAEICDSVFTIEISEILGKEASNVLQMLQYNNVVVKISDGYQGWAEKAPFDAIIVTCAPTHIPETLKEQLREGGRMIIPVGESYNQELRLFEKKNGRVIAKDILPVRFVPMINQQGKTY